MKEELEAKMGRKKRRGGKEQEDWINTSNKMWEREREEKRINLNCRVRKYSKRIKGRKDDRG